MNEEINKNNMVSDKEYAHDKKLMTRYASMKARQSGEMPLKEEVINDIMDAVISITQALATENLVAAFSAGKRLVQLAMKYGPIVWDMYKNYRERKRREQKNSKKSIVPPTQKKLQQFFAEHADMDEKSIPTGDLKKLFSENSKKGNNVINGMQNSGRDGE